LLGRLGAVNRKVFLRTFSLRATPPPKPRSPASTASNRVISVPKIRPGRPSDPPRIDTSSQPKSLDKSGPPASGSLQTPSRISLRYGIRINSVMARKKLR
jgi:hypothetical protein